METKQTAVNWLVNVIQSCIAPNYIPKEIIEQALQMEQKQIEDVAMYHKDNDSTLDCIRSYVEKNYKSNTNKEVLAVLYLYEEIDRAVFNFLQGITTQLELSVEIRHAKNKALQMEREQIIESFMEGTKMDNINNELSARFNACIYYGENYGGEK